MEYFFIRMAAAAGLTGPHSIQPILGHFFESMASYLYNGITNVGVQMLNCFWFVGITIFFNGTPHKIAKRCHMTVKMSVDINNISVH